MTEIYNKAIKLLESNRIPLLVFFSSLFIFIIFAGTRLFLSDEGVIIDQFYNLIHGSLAISIAKIDTSRGVLISVGNNLYGKFSYSLLILSLPVYYILKTMDFLYGAHLFLLQLWALTGGIIVYLIARARNSRYAGAGAVISYIILLAVNLNIFNPIDFSKWGELLSIEFTNILISSFTVLIVYLLFKDFFNSKIALFASFFIIAATPISFYAITLKHHSLAVLLTLLAFYFFHKYNDKKDNKFIYLAYVSAGLCIWTRTLDGIVLLVSLLIADLMIFRRDIKHILAVTAVILISLIPFLSFNYLILGNPFSIIENAPLTDRSITLNSAKDIISLGNGAGNARQTELLNRLGYIWYAKTRGEWADILGNVLFFKLMNTFGAFLVSPFLITAFVFAAGRIKWKLKLNAMDKFFGVFTVLLILLYKNYFLTIITDTPTVLEYRYLLVLYITLLYFALRENRVRELIESRLRTIALSYGIILLAIIIYFIYGFPVLFMSTYYYASLLTSLVLLILLSIPLLIPNKIGLDKPVSYVIALSIALASAFLLFYYWVVSMTYISPSQNYAVLPVMQNILNWMYKIIL